MELKRKSILDVEGNRVEKDFLIDPNNPENDIPLQDTIHEELRRVRGPKVKTGDLEIYFKNPPNTKQLFLKYEPNRNGKLPSNKFEEIKGVNAQPRISNTKYGEFWFQNVYLSPNRRDQVHDDRDETRKNRQHIGDSPTPT